MDYYYFRNKDTSSNEIVKQFRETGDSRYIYQNKIHKACFQHDMAYEGFKDLDRRNFDKV